MSPLINTRLEYEVRTVVGRAVFTTPDKDLAHTWARERKHVLGELSVFEVERTTKETRVYTHRVRQSSRVAA